MPGPHAQLAALAAGLPAELRLTIWLMRGCGLRLGECLAVRGDSFAGGRLRISEQQDAHTDQRGPLKARKPSEYRDIPVPGYVTAALPTGVSGYLFEVKR